MEGVPFTSARTILADAVEMAGGQAEWARKHGFTRSFVCDVLKKRKEVSEAMMNALGYIRPNIWIPVNRGKNHHV